MKTCPLPIRRLLLALLCGAVSWAPLANAANDDTLWKCGGVLTDAPPVNRRKPCVEIRGGSTIRIDTRAAASSATSATSASSASSASPASALRRENPLAATPAQSSRDQESREILETELAAATARRIALREKAPVPSPASASAPQNPLTEGKSDAAPARDLALNRANADIASLQRELARLPADTRGVKRPSN